MREVRIYVEEKRLRPGPLTVSGQAAAHLLKVLRLQPGQGVTLFDGSGSEFKAVLTRRGRETAELEVIESRETHRESPVETCLAVVVPRRERMDFSVQKATELGASVILPLESERSVVRLRGKRARRRQEHWQAVAASACEQCGRNRLPRIESLRTFAEFIGGLGQAAQGELRLIADPGTRHAPAGQVARPGRVLILVGPEGGFTGKEVAAAADTGFRATSLGPRILRSETAAIVLLTMVQRAWGDLPGLGESGA